MEKIYLPKNILWFLFIKLNYVSWFLFNVAVTQLNVLVTNACLIFNGMTNFQWYNYVFYFF